MLFSSHLCRLILQDVQTCIDKLKQFLVQQGEVNDASFQGPRGNLVTAIKMFSGTYAAMNCGQGAAKRYNTGRIMNATERPVLQPVINGEVREQEAEVIMWDLLCYRQSPAKVRCALTPVHLAPSDRL